MSPQIDIILLACVVASACALPGVFLVLRRVALMSDAISHAILLGIVGMFFIVKDIQSPLLIIAAALTGLLTVSLTEMVIASKRIKKDAAIGLIFPVFFSIGVILITQFAGTIHLDQDAVLLGEIAFAPFNRWLVAGIDLGPTAIWVMGSILALNIGLISLLHKELKLSTFDSGLAATLGFSPGLVHYLLMSSVSITAVGAFDAVGSILVVAMMITPPATAYLLTYKLPHMIGLSLVFGWLSAILGYGLAALLDGAIAGAMATMSGIFFLLALFFSPSQGLLPALSRHRQNKLTFAAKMLAVQLLEHENTPIEDQENTFTNLITHMDWPKTFAQKVTTFALSNGTITQDKDRLFLTDLGREVARDALTYF